MPDRSAARALALVVVALSLGSTWQVALSAPGIDFYQYWTAAFALRAGQGRALYDSERGERWGAEFSRAVLSSGISDRQRRAAQTRPALEIYSTPALYAAARAVVRGDYELDYRRFQAASLAAGTLALVLLGRALGFGLVGVALVLAAAGMAFEPARSDVVTGNVNRWLLLGLGGYLALRRSRRPWLRDGAAGTVLGLAVTLKPVLALAAGLLWILRLLERQHAGLARELSGFAAACVLALAASVWAFGSTSGAAGWADWSGALGNLLTDFPAATVAMGNFSPAQIAREAGAPAWIVAGAGLAVVIALLGLLARSAAWVRAQPQHAGAGVGADAPVQDALVLGIGATVVLLFSRLAWLHYFLLCVPLFLAIASPRAGSDSATRNGELALAVLGFLLLSLLPFQISGAQDPRLAALSVDGGAALLLALGMRRLWRGPALAARSAAAGPQP